MTRGDPPRVIDLYVLAKTNETLLIGWKRPATVPDNGDWPITHFQMELKDPNDNRIKQSLDVDRKSGAARTNYMYIFVNLKPGSPYAFQVQACSTLQCGPWSEELKAVTSDGHADPPQSVRLQCTQRQNNRQVAQVSWDVPANVRGQVVAYNVSIEGHSRYRNEQNKFTLDHFREAHEVKGNTTLSWEGEIRPNTNITVRVCTINRSGCGQLSHITTTTMCSTLPTLPDGLPGPVSMTLDNPDDPSSRRLRVSVPRVSERNGPIYCYRIVIIKLPVGSPAERLPPFLSAPSTWIANDLNITSYGQVHADRIAAAKQAQGNGHQQHSSDPGSLPLLQSSASYISGSNGVGSSSAISNSAAAAAIGPEQNSHVVVAGGPAATNQIIGAYVAEELSGDKNLLGDVIIGDDSFSTCDPAHVVVGSSTISNRIGPRRVGFDEEQHSSKPSSAAFESGRVFDGVLSPNTNYSGYVEVLVNQNGTILAKQSPLFAPVQTGIPSQHLTRSSIAGSQDIMPFFSSFSDSTSAMIFGAIAGQTLVLLLLLFVLGFLIKKKASESRTDSDSNGSVGNGGAAVGTIGTIGTTTIAINGVDMHGNLDGTTATFLTMTPEEWLDNPVLIQNLPAVYQGENGVVYQAEFAPLPPIEQLPEPVDDTITDVDMDNQPKERYSDVEL